MQAGHRQIGPLGHGPRREGGVEAQVSAVGLVHQDRDPLGVGGGADARRVADHAVIGGAGVDHQRGVGVLLQGCGHLLRGEGGGDAEGGFHRRHQKDRLQAAQLDGVIDRLVAVAGHQDLVAPAGGGPDGGQQAAGAAVDLKIAPPAAPEGGGAVHGLGQDPAGVVEVVKVRQLGDVQIGPETGQIGGQGGVFLVARHVQGEIPRLVVGLQPFCQRGGGGG